MEPAPDNQAGDETVRQLRARAAALRTNPPAETADGEPDAPEDTSGFPEPSAPAPRTIGDDLLDRWAEDDVELSLEPSHNWSTLVAPIIIVLVLGLAAAAARVLIDGSDDDTGVDRQRSEDAEARELLTEDPPSLDDLTADITLPPGPEVGLQVVEQGITVVEDRFDPARREGTFAVVIENPNLDQLAQGVQVDVAFVDPGGTVVGRDTAFVEVVLPGQRVAVAAHVFDAPTSGVADLQVALDVARWRETGTIGGGFEILTSETTAAEFSGVRTTFEIRSGFADDLVDVGVSAVYRRADGTIIGGADTFLELVEPEVPTAGEVVLLANVDIDDVAATELYVTAAFGSFDPG